MERKICPHCGAPLQAEASFCPRCTATLTERTAMTMPRTGRRRLHLLAACLAAALVALAVWLWSAAETEPQRPNSAADPAAATDPAPDPYLAACQTYYTGADGREYHVFTAVTPSIEGRTDPVGYRSELIPAGGTVDFPATVMVEDAVTQDYAAEDFAALLDRLAEEYDADTSITVELPDVTYDAPVSVGCAVTLKGSGTTFAAPVTVTPLSDTERCHAYVRFSEVSFEGDGGGTGVTARAPTYLENCRVTGWDVGALAVNGGWVYLHGGYIGGNGVGARYDSAYSNSYTYTIRHIDFLNNTTALELLCLPPNSYAALDDCRFRGNGTDVYNPGGYRIEVNNGTEVTL